MALIEDANECCICGKAVHRRIGGVPAYYCADCFETHKNDILANVPWIKYLMNAERQRRKKRNRYLDQGIVLVPVYSETGIVAHGEPATRYVKWKTGCFR